MDERELEPDRALDLFMAKLHFYERMIQKAQRTLPEIVDWASPPMRVRIIRNYEQLVVALHTTINKLRQIPGNPDASEYRFKTKEGISENLS